MFYLLKLATRVLLNSHQITDKASCRAFLIDLILLIKPLAAESNIKLDDALLEQIELALKNEALFDYVYRLISDQFQTEEILLETAEADIIADLINSKMSNSREAPESIDPVVMVTLITQIISVLNAIKNK